MILNLRLIFRWPGTNSKYNICKKKTTHSLIYDHYILMVKKWQGIYRSLCVWVTGLRVMTTVAVVAVHEQSSVTGDGRCPVLRHLQSLSLFSRLLHFNNFSLGLSKINWLSQPRLTVSYRIGNIKLFSMDVMLLLILWLWRISNC